MVRCDGHDYATQPRWTSFMLTTNPNSARTTRSVQLLNSLNISVSLQRAVPANGTEMDKVRSNLLTQRAVYDAIARSSGPADEYIFVFEDDLALVPRVPAPLVTTLLSCGAALSLRHRPPLPVFYAGACAPRTKPFDAGSPVAYAGAALNRTHAVVVGQPLASAVRVAARCAHAYAVRRGDASELRTLADTRPYRARKWDLGAWTVFPQLPVPADGVPGTEWYMDVQLDFWAQQRGGFFLVGHTAESPHEPDCARGIFYQDRRSFRSGIKPGGSSLRRSTGTSVAAAARAIRRWWGGARRLEALSPSEQSVGRPGRSHVAV